MNRDRTYPLGEWSGFDLKRPARGATRKKNEPPDQVYLVSTRQSFDFDCVPYTTGLVVSRSFLDLLGEHTAPPMTLIPCAPVGVETNKTSGFLSAIRRIDCVDLAASQYTIKDAAGHRSPSAAERAAIEKDPVWLALDTKRWTRVGIRDGCVDTGIFQLSNTPLASRCLCTDRFAEALGASALKGFVLTPVDDYLRSRTFA